MSHPTPLKAIRAICRRCMHGSLGAIRNCPDASCPAYPYRFGKNPSLAGKRGHGRPFSPKITPSARDFSSVSGDEGQGSHETRTSPISRLRASRLRMVGAEAGA